MSKNQKVTYLSKHNQMLGISGLSLKIACVTQALALAFSPALTLSANAQAVGQALPETHFTPIEINPSSTILPTDVVPLPGAQERMSFGENMQLRILQKLPAKFYFNVSAESSFRYESNPFQFPTKRKLLSQIYQTTPPWAIRLLNAGQQGQILNTVNLASNDDWVYRILPNITAGWALSSKLRIYSNYFAIRDYLFNNKRLNTTIQSISGGIQRDFAISRRSNLQADFQFRELYQENIQSQFDFLPGLTYSYIATPRTVFFVNTLLQMRGKNYFQAPTKEIDPFYTAGMMYQKGPWSFSNTVTFVQNFRNPFKGNALIPVNNYSVIADFEIAKRLVKWLPGLQGFVRAEPFWNFHSHNTPGLAGFDFRMFFGVRMSLGKPPLTQALEQIRQQLEEQEGTPTPTPAPPENKPESKPSAFIMPYQVIADGPQPIHGFLNSSADTTTISSSNLQSPSTESPNQPAVSLVSSNEVSPAVSQPDLTKSTSSVESTPQAKTADLPSQPSVIETPSAVPIVATKETNTGLKPDSLQLDLASITQTSEKKNESKRHHKREKSPAVIASKPKEIQMVLMPPLPAVNSQSKDNPFAPSGIDVTPPNMIGLPH